MTEGKFEDLGISDEVLRAVRSIGWTVPTPVQAAAIPVGLEGGDLLAQAQTGTGKTGTYGSIILSKTEPGGKDPTALVLVPTRELAMQVADQLVALSKFSGHRCMPIYGGASIENQEKELSKGMDVVVATPGRLKDLIERKAISLSSVTKVVLDEADRMLDMGFLPSVNMILSKVPKDRQTMMFSATMSDDVKKMAVKHMINHKELLISKDEPTLDLTAQFYIKTVRQSKREELVSLFRDGYPKMIVFCRTKRKVDYVFGRMKREKFSVGRIHGDVAQNKRVKTLRDFIEGNIEGLIASDVAARGLDIEDVDLVVNYDMPRDVETYIHRIGRTGRAGKHGKAVTFVNEEDTEMLAAIEKKLGRKLVELPPTSDLYEPWGGEEDPKKRAKEIKQKQAARKVAAEAAIKASEEKQEPKPKKKQKAQEGERTLSGSLDRGRRKKGQKKQPAEKKEGKQEKKGKQQSRGQYPKPQGVPQHPKVLHSYVHIDKAPKPAKDTAYDRLEVSIGKDDGVDQDKLVRFVTKTAHINREDLGNVHVYDDKSRVQVVGFRSQLVVDELFGQKYNGKRVMVVNLSDKQ